MLVTRSAESTEEDLRHRAVQQDGSVDGDVLHVLLELLVVEVEGEHAEGLGDLSEDRFAELLEPQEAVVLGGLLVEHEVFVVPVGFLR